MGATGSPIWYSLIIFWGIGGAGTAGVDDGGCEESLLSGGLTGFLPGSKNLFTMLLI